MIGRSARRRPCCGALVAVLAVGVLACRGERVETFAAQVANGASRYREACASCHLASGGIGPVLSPRVLASYGTAAALFTYVRTTMPYGAPGSLEQDAYWAVVAYLVDSLGGAPPSQALQADNAARVRLRPDGG